MNGKTLVFSLNPAIDVEWKVNDVVWEEKNNILSEKRWAGGKGVNVARAFRKLGGDCCLVLPIGGKSGKELKEFIDAEKIPNHPVPIAQNIRENIVITTPNKGQMRFNPLGPELSRSEWESVFTTLEEGGVETVILSGSLPRNAPVDTYRRLIENCQKHSIRAILDCDGPVFAESVIAHPFLVKPNQFELGQWRGARLSTKDEIICAAQDLAKVTENHVLVSLGKDGALLIWQENKGKMCCFSAKGPSIAVLNTIGAGDAFLAGASYALCRKMDPVFCLKVAVGVGSSVVCRNAGDFPTPAEIEASLNSVEITEIR